MAYPSALNTDKFLTGGVMDAPDLQTRTAVNKLAWGMPISAQEAKRITQRQGLEQQSINVAQDAVQKQALLGMRDVNVGSYAGSMRSPPGSYTAPRANQESVADLILKQRFGTFEQGQMRGTVNPVASTESFAAGPTTTPITTTFRKTPDVNAALGVEGMGNILPQNIAAQNNPVANIPTQAPLIPAPKTISAVPQGGQVQLPPALQQLLGGQAQAQQSAYQVPQYPVGSALAAATPEMQRTALSQKSFGLQKEEFQARQAQQTRQVEAAQNDQKLLAEELAPYMANPRTGAQGREINAREVQNLTARLLARGLSEQGASKLDSTLKLIAGQREPSTEVDRLAKMQRDAFISQNGRQPTQAEDAEIYKNAVLARQAQTNINTGTNQLQMAAYGSLEKERLIASQAQDALQGFAESKKILDSGEFKSGIAANQKLWLAKALVPFGIEDKDVSNTEVLKAQLARPVLGLIKSLGSGAGISDTDREFVENIVGGKITLEAASIQRLVRLGEKMANRAISNYNARLESTFPASSTNPEHKIARSSLMLQGGGGGFTQEDIDAEIARRKANK